MTSSLTLNKKALASRARTRIAQDSKQRGKADGASGGHTDPGAWAGGSWVRTSEVTVSRESEGGI